MPPSMKKPASTRSRSNSVRKPQQLARNPGMEQFAEHTSYRQAALPGCDSPTLFVHKQDVCL